MRKASSKKGGRLAIRPWATDYGITQTFVDRCLAVGAQNQALGKQPATIVL